MSSIVANLLSHNPGRRTLAAILLLALAILTVAAAVRGTEYDEGYTLLLTAGHPRPAWPSEPATAAGLRQSVAGTAGLGAIARDLRADDVHPPLYFWLLSLWQGVVDRSTFAARGPSILLGVAALALVGGVSRLAFIPPAAAMLFTLGCYGFAYVSHIARGFALAQLLTLCGVAMMVVATRRNRRLDALVGGVLCGCAVLTNYLAAFVACSALAWLLWCSPRLFAAGIVGFAALLPASLMFFMAQHGGRPDQFLPFDPIAAGARLALYTAGSVFGALPLYVDGVLRVLVAAVLAGILTGLVALVASRWHRFGTPATNALLGLAAVSPPLGLLALGLVFNSTPIELRYLAFATPFFGLLLAGAVGSLRRWGSVIAAGVLAIQTVSIGGLLTRPESAQPQRAAATAAAALAGPAGLVLIPFGHDGVGVTYPFVAEFPGDTRLLVVPRGANADWAVDRAASYPRAAVARLGLDADSRAEIAAIEAGFAADRCWRPAAQLAYVVAFDRIC